MSAESGTTWLSFVQAQKSQLGVSEALGISVSSEAAFRDAFEAVCIKHREKRFTLLESQLGNSYGHIISSASAIDNVADLLPPDDLAGLFWAASFAPIKSACVAGAKLNGFIKILAELNNSVPRLPNPTLYPEDTSVQGPLQDLFGEYVQCSIFIIEHFQTSSSAFDLGTIKVRVDEAGQRFQDSKAVYDKMLVLAEQNAAKQRLVSQQIGQERHSHYPNGDKSFSNQTEARYIPIRYLGRGSFGEVYEVQEPDTEQLYARKDFNLPESESARARIEKEVRNEVKIMQSLQHHHIAQVCSFHKGPNSLSILMRPVAEYNLLFFLEERCVNGGYSFSEVKKLNPWFGCLLNALVFAHKLNVKHRDIKPENILIKDGKVYLADFGVAKDFKKQDQSGSVDYYVKGTPVYRAPETKPDNPRGRPADVFSLGCVFAEMLTVSKERSLEDFRAYRQAPGDENGSYAFRANLPKVTTWLQQLNTNDTLAKVLLHQTLSMLSEDPDDRPTAQESEHYLKREPALFCSMH